MQQECPCGGSCGACGPAPASICGVCYDSSIEPPCGFCASPGRRKATPSTCGISNCRRHSRVFAKKGAQCLLQRTEPRLVCSPVLDGVAEDGLAHLLGARRADGPLVLVEPEALLLERQIAVSEQAPKRRLRIGEDGLREAQTNHAGHRATDV